MGKGKQKICVGLAKGRGQSSNPRNNNNNIINAAMPAMMGGGRASAAAAAGPPTPAAGQLQVGGGVSPRQAAEMREMFNLWEPGVVNSGNAERRTRKDATRMGRAQTWHLPESTREALDEPPPRRDWTVVEAAQHAMGKLSPEELRNLEPFGKWIASRRAHWERVLFGEIAAHETRGEWRAIADKAGTVLAEMERKRVSLGLHRERLLPVRMNATDLWEAHALDVRAQARLRGLGDPQGASEDLTLAHAFHQALQDYQSGTAHSTMTVKQAKILLDRAECFDRLGEYKNALVDLKGVCAAVRTIGKEAFALSAPHSDHVPESSAYLMLAVMAKKKMQQGAAARPLFSEAERETIMKDLGLWAYVSTRYNCAKCHARPTEKRLNKCARCQLQWYCCKDHQVAAWKEFHSDQCCRMHSIHSIPEEMKVEAEEALERDGHWFSRGFLGQPEAFIRDPVSGRLFDPLTNWDVYFVPPDRLKVIETLMSTPADKTDGKQLLRHMTLELAKKSRYLHHEVDWLRTMVDIFLNKRESQVEIAATKLIESIEGIFPNLVKYRAWVAILLLVSGYSSRSWALYKIVMAKPYGIKRRVVFGSTGKPSDEYLDGDPLDPNMPEIERGIEDATKALNYVQLLNQWTGSLGPSETTPQRLYIKKYEGLLLMHRGVLKKLKRDFVGAVEDLRPCMSIFRRFSFASIEKAQMFTRLGSDETCLGNALFHCQMAMTLQRVAPSGELYTPLETPPEQPLFGDAEQQELPSELGLDRQTMSADMLIVNNEGMGDADRWAFDHYGVFGTCVQNPTTSHEELRMIVPDTRGGYFEAFSDQTVDVMTAEGAVVWAEMAQNIFNTTRDIFQR